MNRFFLMSGLDGTVSLSSIDSASPIIPFSGGAQFMGSVRQEFILEPVQPLQLFILPFQCVK